MATRVLVVPAAAVCWDLWIVCFVEVQHPGEATASEGDLPGDCAALVVTDDRGIIWQHAEQ
ncbi:MAG: hypothetical protein P8L31_11855 [Pseudomonadales bacterium]|nr:hypothetical protein [Pseudomonadales bacterium]